MARLIDADALRNSLSARKMTEIFPNWKLIPYCERESILKLANCFKCAIDDAPTIDEPIVARCSKHREGEHADADD